MPNDELSPILVATAAAAQEFATATTVAAQEDSRTVNGILRSHILAENERLRNDNQNLSDLREQNARLKVLAEISIIGDVLFAVGSIGFGFLGSYGREKLPILNDVDFSLCLGGVLFTAIIGLGMKSFLWFRQITGK